MLIRRFLRVKAFKVLLSCAYADNHSLIRAEKELTVSLEKTYDLYHFLFAALTAVADHAEERIEIGLRKFKPTEEEAHPNRKFINNELITIIQEYNPLQQYCRQHFLNWRNYPDIVHTIYQNMIARPYYKEYMASPNQSLIEDSRLVEEFFRNELEGIPKVEHLIEEMNAHWADDIGYVLGSIIRTLGNFLPEHKEGRTGLMPMYFAKEDKDYVYALIRRSMVHYKEYSNLAYRFIKNWESDRIAYADIALIVMGMTEAVAFPHIPIKVTINEYVEIAKFYSTRNSHVFVNGVLDKILQHLVAKGTIKKTGRGLIKETVPKKEILKPRIK